MRKFVKNELLGIIQQLDKANEVLLKNANSLSAEQAVNVLTECQQSAIVVGSKIDEVEGEGTVTVTLLEEYCEELYSLSINWGDIKQITKTGKHIRLLLNKIGNSILYDLSDSKKEVVFLPYKASMWDSLESVWMAARDDETCDAYVIPIPYFDKNPDGTFREAHYEGDLYPDYVPITHYNDYDFKAHHPDVIFIHNPYDEWNHVTSVHPFFYSKNLKQFTEKLVYIPYFVTGGEVNSMQKLLPSYLNMDYIIAQNKYQKMEFDTAIQEKVYALGSPKFDKVINYKISEKEIPEEWKSKLREKVLFVNTGIDGILKNNEKSLLKIQYLIEVVKKEEITLLWRPHPLLESTIQSMRPELWNLYLETIEKFEKLSNGILDRTGNVELAIKLSDAYLGEPTSSISHMFGVLGKPICFIRQGLRKEDKDVENVKISCCTTDTNDANTIWAVVANRNGLIKIAESGKIEEFYFIPNEKDTSNLYSDILSVGKKLYLIPRNAKEIAVFDIEEKQFVKIELMESKQKEKFNKGFFYEGKIYLVPRLYPDMVILNCVEGKIYYDRNVVEEIKKMTGIPDILVSANGSRLYEDSIYLGAPNKPYLFKYHLNDGVVEKIDIQKAKGGFCCIEIVNNKFVLGSMDKCELIVWEPMLKTLKVIRHFPIGWDTKEDICFWDIIGMGNNVYIFPRKSPMILRLNLSDFSLSPLEKEFPFSIENRKGAFYNHPNHFLVVKKMMNGKVIVQDANRHGFCEFCEDGTFEWKPVMLTDNDELDAMGKSFARQAKNVPWGIYETKHYSVHRFISYILQDLHDAEKQKEAFSCVTSNLDGTAGAKIYSFVIE